MFTENEFPIYNPPAKNKADFISESPPYSAGYESLLEQALASITQIPPFRLLGEHPNVAISPGLRGRKKGKKRC